MKLSAGMTFSRWTIIDGPIRYGRRTKWLCKCVCGKMSEVEDSNLKLGRSTSCGCKAIETNRKRLTVHGSCARGKRPSPTYSTWQAMRLRCEPDFFQSQYYYDKGIRVCQTWASSYKAFLNDMGERKPGMTLDRIDNSKGYYKENCRWATTAMQARNYSSRNVYLTYQGLTLVLSDWATMFGCQSPGPIKRLLDQGKSIEEIAETLRASGRWDGKINLEFLDRLGVIYEPSSHLRRPLPTELR